MTINAFCLKHFYFVLTVSAVWLALSVNEQSLRQVRYAKLQDSSLWESTLDLELPVSGRSLDSLPMSKVVTICGDWRKADVRVLWVAVSLYVIGRNLGYEVRTPLSCHCFGRSCGCCFVSCCYGPRLKKALSCIKVLKCKR
jgi:hypothetical protein